MEESFWNDRYSRTQSSYGDEPNVFLKESLLNLTPGTLLLPGEGEGRNAVFAAKHGWKVSAFDFSEVARTKALARAHQERVIIDYEIGHQIPLSFPSHITMLLHWSLSTFRKRREYTFIPNV